MSDQTPAFLALWNKFDAALLAEYECWHTFEHVPERVSVPGFVAAKRYAQGEGAQRLFFTLYDIDSLEVLETAAYAELINQPSAWSERMRVFFSGFRRFPCRPVAAAGRGIAATVATLTLALGSEADAERLAAPLHELLARGGITAFRLGVSIVNPQYKVFEQDFVAAEASAVAVVVIEATTRDVLIEATRALAEPVRLIAEGANPEWEIFDLLYAISRQELAQTDRWRTPPRDDLRALFSDG